jgi:O-antigen/teichoic acid export membrane protein
MEGSTYKPRPLTGGAVRSAIAQAAVAVAGALTTLIVARLLGPSGAGAYAIALSLLLGLMALGTAGLETGTSYMVSAGRWSPQAAFRQTQLVALGLGLAAAGAGLGVRYLAPSAFEGVSVELIVVTAAALPFVLSWLYASYLALALDRYETYALPPVVQSVVALVAVTGLCAVYGLDGAIAGLLVSHAVAAALTFVRARREAAEIPPPAGASDEDAGSSPLFAAVRFGGKTYLANALGFITYRFDLFVLNAAASQAAVGRYSVAVSVTSAIWLLPRGLSGVVLPRVAALSATEQGAHREMVEVKSMRHVSLLVALSALAMATALVVLVEPLFGADFRAAIGLGLILLPGSALLGLSGVLSATTIGRGHPMYSLYNALITTPIAIALYALLIPAMGATGAALASTVLYTLSFAITAWFYRRVTGRRLLPLLIPTRSELRDYRLAGRAARARLLSRRRPRESGSTP